MGQGRSDLYNAPWIALLPGLAMFVATIIMSIIGDWLRDPPDLAGRQVPPADWRDA